MRNTLLVLSIALTLSGVWLGCGTDSKPCEVADACASACLEECAPNPTLNIACVGTACRCTCDTSGSGGSAGTGGMGGGAGTAE